MYMNQIIKAAREREERQSFFKVGVNEMPVRPIHDVMFIGHATSAKGLLTSLRMDTMVVTR